MSQRLKTVSCDEYSLRIKATEQYKKDSNFLSYTVNRWIDSSYGSFFGRYNKINSANGFYKVHVGDIFYDSAKLKLTAFVFIEYSTDYIDTLFEKIKEMKSHLFDSYTVMGYRDSLNQFWKLFELEEIFMGIRGNSLMSAKEYHASIFLNKKEMGERSIAIYDEKTGLNTKYEPVKYLPCENDFWTKSPLWKKGIRVPGYYIFETYQNATPLKMDIRPVWKINYSDSLIKVYSEAAN
jgi:hypothetical protein